MARTVRGNVIASSEDYLEALKHYDSVIDPRNPDRDKAAAMAIAPDIALQFTRFGVS
jgi:hypothetical protein